MTQRAEPKRATQKRQNPKKGVTKAGSMPGAGARLVGSFWIRLSFLAVLSVRNDIGPAQPAREIHIGAATRAEGTIFRVGGAAADRTLAVCDRGRIGLRHAITLHGPPRPAQTRA